MKDLVDVVVELMFDLSSWLEMRMYKARTVSILAVVVVSAVEVAIYKHPSSQLKIQKKNP